MEAIGYNQLWKAIIRPPRCQYDLKDLGPSQFLINRKIYVRNDFEVKSHKNLTLQCSHYEPLEDDRDWEQMPCVIYLHGNSSARIEAIECAQYILQSNMTLFCFDFAGCGMSEGEYISLGWYEREDLEVIVNHLRQHRRVSTIGLWGRSMGAVTALMYGDRDPSIGGMVLDSPFSNMKVLVNELSKTQTKIPSLLISAALKMIRKTIKSKAQFDIFDLNPIDHVSQSFIPAVFAAANQDDFILPHHCDDLYAKYAGDKNIVKFDGDHNSLRPEFFFDSSTIFFINRLQVNELCSEQNKIKKNQQKANKSNKPNQQTAFSGSGQAIGGGEDEAHEGNVLYELAAKRRQMGMYQNVGLLNQDEVDQINDDGEDEELMMQQVLAESMKQFEAEQNSRKQSQNSYLNENGNNNHQQKEENKCSEEEQYLINCMKNVNVNDKNQSNKDQINQNSNNDNSSTQNKQNNQIQNGTNKK